VALESAARKSRFITRAVAACSLSNVEVVNRRAEFWVEGLARFDLVLARAVAALDVVLEYAAPLLVVGGSLVAWRGGRDLDAEAAAERAAAALGMRVGDPLTVRPYPAVRERHLHLFSKMRETPEEFPRRPGAAAKRPLGTL
jgi:16S rRNA (guanine527-N7)-methyltransferase